MIISDKKDFSDVMIRCFQNYRANISKDMIDEWFEELKQFPFFNIKKAFTKYTNEVEKFPPTRATIIKFSKMQFGIEKEEYRNQLGCINMIGDKNCGKYILVHQHCEECYELRRPKNDVDLKIIEQQKKDRENAIAASCVTEKDFGDYAKKQLRSSAVGKLIINLQKTPEEIRNESKRQLENAVEDFRTGKCSPHNNPETFRRLSEFF